MNETRHGTLYGFFAADHARLAEHFDRATADPRAIDRDAYAVFRQGLLRHIGLEEKILLPFAKRAQRGEPLSMAKQLRREHATIASLLVPTPTPEIVTSLRSILAHHNAREEGPGGLYEACEALVENDVEPLLARLRAAPEVSVNPHVDNERAQRSIANHLHRIGFDEYAR
ncbi:MAG: hemerythrin domain-containing protein [Deltaproteobacteria bacterium]|nr:hemerythrin domain-containing protein [Deltaproteobacteria bacterium]